MNSHRQLDSTTRSAWLIVAIIACPVAYLLSSGPDLATGFWLRETTGWDGFYAVMYVYFPIPLMGHGNPIDAYIDWWISDVFGTVGPR